MKEITLETKIADLLNNYNGMKDILIDINPKFEKLNNPILRRTIAKVAGVKQAAIVGGMQPIELLNKLREAVGQSPINFDNEQIDDTIEDAPLWINQEVKVTLNVNELLDKDKNPLSEINKLFRNLQNNDMILLKSDFKPEPLIEEFVKKGYKIYSKEESKNSFLTYILK